MLPINLDHHALSARRAWLAWCVQEFTQKAAGTFAPDEELDASRHACWAVSDHQGRRSQENPAPRLQDVDTNRVFNIDREARNLSAWLVPGTHAGKQGKRAVERHAVSWIGCENSN